MIGCLFLTSLTESQEVWEESWMENQLQLAGQGNSAALERIYRRTSPSLYAYLLSVLKNRADAEDALQDTYVAVFQSASRYQANGRSKSWIFTIARNQAMMRFREQKHYAGDGESILELYPAKDHSQQAQDRLALETALKLLPDKDCQIVILHAAAGFKHREISRLLDLPLNTVLSKYHRSIKQLKRKLTEGEADA